MTIRDFLAEVSTGWHQTFRKWSVRISAIETFVMGLLSVCSVFLPLWVLPLAYVVFKILGLLASNISQVSVASYDPRYFRLIPIESLPNADK